MSLLDRIKARCVEIGECWIWQGSCNSVGHPTMSHKSRPHLVRRLAYEASGRSIRSGYVVRPTCRYPKCCNPTHLVAITIKQRNLLIYAEQRKNLVLLAKKMRERAIKSGQAKLTEEQVREIRASCEPSKVLAERYGVTPASIYKARTGRSWKQVGVSVFSWRP